MDETQPESDQASWATYRQEAKRRALALGNRGPLRYDGDGGLQQDILAAYRQTGFYVFIGVLDQDEIDELAAEFDEVLANAPTARGSTLDEQGRPVRFPGYYALAADDVFRRPGTERIQSEDQPPIVSVIAHPLMLMDSALRLYGHPDILRIAASVNGDDFVPFHETIFYKAAGEGPPTPWHQDGRTHWDDNGNVLEQPDGGGKTHGFNLSVSWTHCTPENCLWVVPGSHHRWRLANRGTYPKINERLPDAVPVMLEPGDCAMVNRSTLHGAYANTSAQRRATMVLGFHKRDSAIGTTATNVHAFRLPGGTSKEITYSEDYVLRRARMIPLAVDARRRHYPDEVPYAYRGTYIGEAEWNERTRAEIRRQDDEYWQRDITL